MGQVSPPGLMQQVKLPSGEDRLAGLGAVRAGSGAITDTKHHELSTIITGSDPPCPQAARLRCGHMGTDEAYQSFTERLTATCTTH